MHKLAIGDRLDSAQGVFKYKRTYRSLKRARALASVRLFAHTKQSYLVSIRLIRAIRIKTMLIRRVSSHASGRRLFSRLGNAEICFCFVEHSKRTTNYVCQRENMHRKRKISSAETEYGEEFTAL